MDIFKLKIELDATSDSVVEDVAVVVEDLPGAVEDDISVSGGDSSDVEDPVVDVKVEVFGWTELNEGINFSAVGEVGATFIEVADFNGVVIVKHFGFIFIAVEKGASFNDNSPGKKGVGVVLDISS
jgi:hypothetical protein